MTFRRLTACLITALCLTAPAADAATIDYDEATDGDLPTVFSFTSPAPLFVIDAKGTNSVRGTRELSDTEANGFVNESDVFYVEVPLGFQISAFSLSFSNLITTNLSPDSTLSFSIFDGAALRFGQQLDGFQGGFRTPLAEFDGPLGTGLYRFAAAGGSLTGTQSNRSMTTDYTFSFETSAAPVPLPAGLPLALAGLGSLALLRRLRQRE